MNKLSGSLKKKIIAISSGKKATLTYENEQKWKSFLIETFWKDKRQTICNTDRAIIESTEHLYCVLEHVKRNVVLQYIKKNPGIKTRIKI